MAVPVPDPLFVAVNVVPGLLSVAPTKTKLVSVPESPSYTMVYSSPITKSPAVTRPLPVATNCVPETLSTEPNVVKSVVPGDEIS